MIESVIIKIKILPFQNNIFISISEVDFIDNIFAADAEHITTQQIVYETMVVFAQNVHLTCAA